MSEEPDIIREIDVPDIEVPKDFGTTISEAELDKIPDVALRNILRSISVHDRALTFLIREQKLSRTIDVKVVQCLTAVQKRLVTVSDKQKPIGLFVSRFGKVLLIAITALVTIVVQRVVSNIRWGPPPQVHKP